MANTDNTPPSKLVQTLSSDASLVSYRAFVGLTMAAMVGLLAFIGNDLRSGQLELQKSMSLVRVNVGRNSSRLDDQVARITKDENDIAINTINVGLLDHRMTYAEAKLGIK